MHFKTLRKKLKKFRLTFNKEFAYKSNNIKIVLK
jgi:hypothetical protein